MFAGNDFEDEIAFQVGATPPYFLNSLFETKKRGGSLPGKAPNKARDWESRHQRLMEQYFVPRPVYNEFDFRRRFRCSKRLFERVLEAVAGHDSYFEQRRNCAGKLGISTLLKVTAAFRMLAYGAAADALDENLEMSETTIFDTLMHFTKAVSEVFGDEYLRTPTQADTVRMMALMGAEGFHGCMGAVDCMHWEWHACPAAHAGQYLGKGKRTTVVLEAVVGYDLWFWHASFGYPGSLNDLNILDRSPLFDELLEGRAPKVSYELNGSRYSTAYFLADGIYPDWPVFMKTIAQPTGLKHQHYALRQEATRKSVERGFGVVQARFRVIQQPFRQWSLDAMRAILRCCLILHNMVVEDEREIYGNDMYDYLFEEERTGAQVTERLGLPYVNVTRPPPGERVTSVDALVCNLECMKRQSEHNRLKQDLIEHLWGIHGSGTPTI
eukprot:GHVU01005576.1.p1 GENE.GHVU01005576.1~~GHVU01005576.1.p1  ORF type:complete len:440 (+),score=48.73 GHVU01005576.1:219-1538(+)